MKPKTMILMVVAVTCGLGASYMTSQLLAERGTAEEQEKVDVLVAVKNLETGATIKHPLDMFQAKKFAKGDEPKNAINTLDELKGRVLKRSLREGDFVSPADLLSDKESEMAYNLPNGNQAVGLRVNIEGIAGGFASLPLSRVDIYGTFRRADDKSSFCMLLLQNVLVLAADQTYIREEGKVNIPATTVTVALPPEDIQKVNLAKEFGPLSLGLRKFNDNRKFEVAKLTFEDVMNGTKPKDVVEQPVIPPKIEPKVEPKVEPPPEPEAPKTKTHVVTILNDGRQEQVEFTIDIETNEVVSSRVLPRDAFPASRAENPPAQPAPKRPGADL